MNIQQFVKSIGQNWVKGTIKDGTPRYYVAKPTDEQFAQATQLKGEELTLSGVDYFLAVRAKGTPWQRDGRIGITGSNQINLIPNQRETVDLSDMLG